MKVRSLIERVLQKYAAVSRYSDRGTALVTAGGDKTKITFETAFERPDRFSFSFTARHSDGRLWSAPSIKIEHPVAAAAVRQATVRPAIFEDWTSASRRLTVAYVATLAQDGLTWHFVLDPATGRVLRRQETTCDAF